MNTRPFRSNRAGSIESTLAVSFVGLIAIGCLAHFVVGSLNSTLTGFFDDKPTLDYLSTKAFRAPFVHMVLERGEVESSSNVEVRCEVKSRSTGINIIEIVPEGKWVEKGEFLVRLDDSILQTSLIEQQIVCSNSEAATIEAEAKLDSARLALSEYDEGTYVEQLAQQESAVFVAEENNRRAQEYVQYSKRLAERGYIPAAQLEADKFALEKAKKELGVAATKLEVLKKFTREKMLTQLRADIKTAEAKLSARQKTWELDKVQLAEVTEQVKLCEITAPVAGQVVYANNRGRSSSATLIEEGLPVRQRQTIINLPDPKKMQVIAKVHESRIGYVKKGMEASLRLDSMPELPLEGRVTEVSEYPLPPISVYMAHVKEYEVLIQIEQPPLDLRPGMTAEVNILVEELDDALLLPIEAVVERSGRFFCAVPTEGGDIETRELTVGTANETDLVVLSGLHVDEEVVLNISDEQISELLNLPEEDS